uniref:Uncharacterized protein n=1 Tax=Arundo donax TaxID=35708 RepID=A0A0A8Z752_ARUDO
MIQRAISTTTKSGWSIGQQPLYDLTSILIW